MERHTWMRIHRLMNDRVCDQALSHAWAQVKDVLWYQDGIAEMRFEVMDQLKSVVWTTEHLDAMKAVRDASRSTGPMSKQPYQPEEPDKWTSPRLARQ